ncbi:MAG: hypothetical protein CVU16_06295 [Betaproteobacteria bacterium HGW-Betaproteobacteria-10]|nr:MAG: hypothetical protein CVU16_06295 [Betaproteobacteria bacterium HGW-Betaproteobacteria-10]
MQSRTDLRANQKHTVISFDLEAINRWWLTFGTDEISHYPTIHNSHKVALIYPVHPELVEGQTRYFQGLRQAQPKRF